MKLPSNYLELIAAGAAALRELGRDFRAAADRNPQLPELWLSVRDCEGLAGRLIAVEDWEWQQGSGTLLISPQDLGVLDELLSGGGSGPVAVSPSGRQDLSRLRRLLVRYETREFEFDDLSNREHR